MLPRKIKYNMSGLMYDGFLCGNVWSKSSDQFEGYLFPKATELLLDNLE